MCLHHIMYMSVFLHVWICTLCIPDAHRGQRRALSSLIGVTGGYESRHGCLVPNLAPQQEQLVYLTTE